jgi:hypothetical protein
MGLEKSKQVNLDVRNISAGSHTEHVLRNPKLASAEDGFSFCRLLLSLCSRIPKKISIDAKLMVRIAISYYMYVCRGGMLDANG